jgi:16S rRNA processing protein RimM
VLGPRGLRGELRIKLFRSSSSYFDAGRVILSGRAKETTFEIREATFSDPSTAVLSLDGIEDREAAEAWNGALVHVEREWFTAEEGPEERLIGAQVIDASDGREIGRVARLLDNGAQTLLAIGEGDAEKLIPYVDAFIEKVAVEAGELVIRVRLIPGLIE